jgi:hypothetical protein
MSRILLVTAILFYAGCASVAQSGPRLKAQEYFEKSFPLAELEEWAQRDDGFVVSFFDVAEERSVELVFDIRGRWQQSTMSLGEDALRANVLQYLEENFNNYLLTAYEVKLRNKQRRIGLVVDTPEIIYTLEFNDDGQLIERYEEGIDG